MLIGKPGGIPSSEITPKSVFLNRRKFLAGVGLAAVGGVGLRDIGDLLNPPLTAYANAKIDGIQKSSFNTTEAQTPYKDVTNYNNFYEFSTDKYEPAGLAKDFKTRPWTLKIEGDVKQKQELQVDAIITVAGPAERIYRHRCVEVRSFVALRVGFSLIRLIKPVQPLSKAKP